MSITVVKRNGEREPYDANKINLAIEHASAGLDENITWVTQIASELELTLFDGITTQQLDEAVIQVALQNVKDDPQFDTVAARLLLKTIYKRVLGDYTTAEAARQPGARPEARTRHLHNRAARGRAGRRRHRHRAPNRNHLQRRLPLEVLSVARHAHCVRPGRKSGHVALHQRRRGPLRRSLAHRGPGALTTGEEAAHGVGRRDEAAAADSQRA